MMVAPQSFASNVLITSCWIFLAWLIYGQALSAFDYNLGVSLGTQFPSSMITDVGVAFFLAFALIDTLFYIPLLLLALTAFWTMYAWWIIVLSAVLGISVYWPIAILGTLLFLRDDSSWKVGDGDYYFYTAVLPCVTAWALFGLWVMLSEAVAYERVLTLMETKSVPFWVVQFPGWLLMLFLIVSQALTAINYDAGVALGVEEPVDQVTTVGAGFFYGFCIADLIASMPMLLLGLLGHWHG